MSKTTKLAGITLTALQQQALDQLIQDERKETVEEYKQRIIELECEIVRLLSDKIDKDALQDLLKELTKGDN
jgi:hypothetical protein